MTLPRPLAALALLCLAPLVHAQPEKDKPKPVVLISKVAIGLPAGAFSGEVADADGGKQGLFKAGSWTPVWVRIRSTKQTGPLELVVTTNDSDDDTYSVRVPVAPLLEADPDDPRKPYEIWAVAYSRTGTTDSKFDVDLRDPAKDNSIDKATRSFAALSPQKHLFAAVGSTLPGLRLGPDEGGNPEEGTKYKLYRGKVELAHVTDLEQMPDRWLGYAGCDMLVLGSGGNSEFLSVFSQPRFQAQREAIREYVRRGGSLVVSAGANPDLLEALPEIREVLPVKLDLKAKREAEFLQLQPVGSSAVSFAEVLRPGNTKLFVVPAAPKPDRAARPIIQELPALGKARPIGYLGSFGLGRVAYVGFDLDRGPIIDWPNRAAFWEYLANEAGPRLGNLPNAIDSLSELSPENADPALNDLQTHLDTFEGVPVISFGWVALFILGYILLIGPVDYFILKKFFGKLEYTWITFPIIVVLVSVAAYWGAYRVKGRDMKINRLDLVEYDAASGKMFGKSYLTIFSPRMQSYTIGLEPSAPEWTSADAAETQPELVMGWQGKTKALRQTGISRQYALRSGVDAEGRDLAGAGIDRVPIAVWSTKGFYGEWTAPAPKDTPPIESTLHVTRQSPNVLVGNVTSHLPLDAVAEAKLIWRGRIMDLPDLTHGVPQRVLMDYERGGFKSVDEWLGSDALSGAPLPSNADPAKPIPGQFNLWSMAFAERKGGANAAGGFARRIDQSWRLRPEWDDQALLVLRVYRTERPAEEFNADARTPAKLWLGEFPGSGDRPKLQGSLRQGLFFRAYLPVKPAPTEPNN